MSSTSRAKLVDEPSHHPLQGATSKLYSVWLCVGTGVLCPIPPLSQTRPTHSHMYMYRHTQAHTQTHTHARACTHIHIQKHTCTVHLGRRAPAAEGIVSSTASASAA